MTSGNSGNVELFANFAFRQDLFTISEEKLAVFAPQGKFGEI